MIENLLNDDLLLALIKAINNNEPFTYDKDGLVIKSTDNSFSISYDSRKDNAACTKERAEFTKYIDNIEDWVEVCEFIGQSELKRLDTLLNSDNLESVRSVIIAFKQYYKQYLQKRINYYKDCLAKA